jgi:putative oxidoreductase
MSTVTATPGSDLEYNFRVSALSGAEALVPLGRVFYSLIFILSGFGHFSKGMVDYAANQGVPMAGLLVPLSGAMALIGGISIMLGYRARWGAFLLILFLIPVSLIMHNFWSLSDPIMVQMQRAHFLKNLGLLGGALLIFYFGAGPLSMDWMRRDKT